jgi:hypothetical protein
VSVRPSLRPTSGPYQGAVVPLIPQKLVVDCQAPASRDGAGKRVSYGPSSAFDKNLTTAWRCNGSGRNRHLLFSFAAGTKVVQLGLVNGYAKVDPRTTEKRYGEYRRITAVTWTFPNGAAFEQQLRDGDESAQTIRIPTQLTRQLTLTIDKTTQPGQRTKTRDAVLISEVAIAGPQG